MTLNLPFLELGTSKNICWVCDCFITAIGEGYTGIIHFWARQGKVHAGWRFPEGTSVAVRDTTEQRLSHEMDTVLARASRSSHSDSEPGGRDDEEESDEEDLWRMGTKDHWTTAG